MGDDDMPIHSEHMTELDCTDEDNRIQARFELDRADETRTPAAMAAWAAKWGRALLTAADSLGDAVDEEKEASEDANALREKIKSVIADLQEAIA